MFSAASALGFPCDPISIYTLLFVDIAKISWTAFCWVFVSLSSLCLHRILCNFLSHNKHHSFHQTLWHEADITHQISGASATLFKSMTSWCYHVFTRWCNVSLFSVFSDDSQWFVVCCSSDTVTWTTQWTEFQMKFPDKMMNNQYSHQ